MFWNGRVASTFFATRSLPSRCARQLIASATGGDIAGRTIVDIGCGTGRFLRGLRESKVNLRYIGVDKSPEMLRVAAAVIGNDVRFSLQNADFSKGPSLGVIPDVILCHWVANATARWPDVLAQVGALSRDGAKVVWFLERSDLYQWIDGIDVEHASGLTRSFWRAFYSGIGSADVPAALLRRRAGTGVNSGTEENFFRSLGMNVEHKSDQLITWRSERSLRWIETKILTDRCFSNLGLLSPSRLERGLTKVRALLSRYPADQHQKISIRHTAYPLVARW